MNDLFPWLGPIIAAAALLYTIFGNNRKAHDKKFVDMRSSISTVETQLVTAKSEIDQRVDKVEDRVVRIEADMRHLPDKDVTQRLELAMAELRGDVRTLAEQVKPIGAMANRMQEAILEKVAHG